MDPVRCAKKVWEEHGLRPCEEEADRRRKAKTAKDGKGKGGKGQKGGEGGKTPNKKRAHSAQWTDEGSAHSPQNDSEGESWSEEEAVEDPEDQWWSEGDDSPHHRAKKVKETSAMDELFY